MWAKALLLSLAVATIPVAASAQPVVATPTWVEAQYRDRGGGRGDGDVRPLRDVVEEIRSRYGGELISARLEGGPSPVYVLRWRMPDGEVRDFRVSAR